MGVPQVTFRDTRVRSDGLARSIRDVPVHSWSCALSLCIWVICAPGVIGGPPF